MTPDKETKQRILKAAFDRFSTTHYSRVSLNDIMSDVGISKGGLFHHFDSKLDLALECLFNWANEAYGPQMTPESVKNSDPREVLGGIIDLSFDLIVQNKQLTMFFMSLYEESIQKGRKIDIWREFFDSYVEIVKDCFERMGAKDPRSRAIMFLAGMDGLGLYHVMIRDNMDRDYIERMKREIYRTYVDDN